MTTARTFWDKAADKYAASPVKNMPAYEHTLDRVRAHLKPTDKVLEIGCGTGTTALKLADAAGHITGTDISGRMIEIAQGKANDQGVANVDFRQATPGDGSLGAETYDAVTAFNILHLLPNLPAVLAEIHDRVEPGGLFISKSVCLQGIWRAMWLPVAVMQVFGKAPYVRFMTPGTLEKMLREAGFDIIETGDFPKSPPSHFVVARKV